MKTDSKELKQLAMDICEGKIFGTWDVPEREQALIPTIFWPLALMDKADRPSDIVHVYESLDKAAVYRMNDMPLFNSCKFIFKEDIELLQSFIDIYNKRRDDFMQEDIPEENVYNLVNSITESLI